MEEIITFIVLLALSCATAQDVTVVTNLGNITGEVDTVSFDGASLNVIQFLGIPYAEPPKGSLRFHKPVKKAAFNGNFIAKTKSPICFQNPEYIFLLGIGSFLPRQDEDCLYLNIFIPGSGPLEGTEKRAVMVWIYGGDFQIGDQETYDAKAFVGLNDVVLVTLNYRLSLFGFLSTSENNLSGNYGLWDQQMAIQWVHDHIESFGGDPMKVTIFGESAGAASVVYQAMYEGNEGLFQRVIAQSGSANSAWAYQTDPAAAYLNFANKSGCFNENRVEIIRCLRNLTSTDIVDLLKYADAFRPVTDGEFVKIHPVELYLNSSAKARDILRRLADLDFIFGVTSAEGGSDLPAVDYKLLEMGYDYNRAAFESTIVPLGLETGKKRATTALKQAVIHQYVDWSTPDNKETVIEKTTDLFSDIFIAPVVTAADSHSDSNGNGHLYFYVFDYKSPLSDPRFSGAAHADDIPYVLGFPSGFTIAYALANKSISKTEFDFSKSLMQFWTNFAKTG